MSDEAKRLVSTVALHRGQMQLMMSKAPITEVIGGIRSGKSQGGSLWSIKQAIENPCKEDQCHAVASPSFPMSLVPVQKLFAWLYDKKVFPVSPLIKYYKRDRIFELKSASGDPTRIKVFSMHEPDTARGWAWRSMWYDEGAYGSEYSWQVAQGRLADTSGPALITTSPAGYNWCHEEYRKARKEHQENVPIEQRTRRVIHFTSLENPWVRNEPGLQRLITSYDETTYQQEVLARFIKQSGLVYYPFNLMRNAKHHQFDPNREVWVGQDFNVNPMASVLGQPFVTKDGQPGVHWFYERKAQNSDTFALIKFLNRFCETNNIDREKLRIFPDASSRARSTSGKSDFRLLREARYSVDAPLANPFVRDRINTVNSLIMGRGSPYPRLLVDPRCVNLIEAFEKQSWDTDVDPPQPSKVGGFDHILDALGYACWRKLPLRGRMSLGGVPETRRAA